MFHFSVPHPNTAGPVLHRDALCNAKNLTNPHLVKAMNILLWIYYKLTMLCIAHYKTVVPRSGWRPGW